ncbi:helix-turn-helix domain-containing protein [Paenibacillus beijingensis]|uniref:HTH araC/xylS-type domain-containing protein n=1 Tax=Paenibacillus beijingensis TaxID=1126833 RepID=A0A0D5NMD5_9BACL|nr:AraC family transcriptional regulator [Paenibacillus beijingensis]AJY76132.1 hypothetical protein VN24_18180 [Paenibacillus beijingensis]
MELLQLRTNLNAAFAGGVPFYVYTVGTEKQPPITRLNGFSAKQLFFTISGQGEFRQLGQHNWDILKPNRLLYIPGGLPHEYVPKGREPWITGYVTFVEKEDGWMESWGFGRKPQLFDLKDSGRLYALLEKVWFHAGPCYNEWKSAEQFLALCVEIGKQAVHDEIRSPGSPAKPSRDPDTAAGRITRFLHDHIERNFTLSDLASYVGYSPKQTVRLFRQEFGVTPHQYLQRIRLRTAALLLEEHPGVTVRQAAAHIGMEPVYFARLFRREFGVVPSEYGTRGTSGS